MYISNGAEFQVALSLNTLPQVPQTTTLFDNKNFKLSHTKYADYNFVPQDNGAEIELVLGSDCFWNLLYPECRIQIAEYTFLYHTVFGWALVGCPLHCDSPDLAAFFLLKPEKAIEKLCALEAIGITDLPLSALKEEEIALQSFYTNLAFQAGRYVIGWPWKSFPPNLRNNYALALGRLRTLHSKLSPAAYAEYDKVMKQQLAVGVIEIVPQQQQKVR